MPAETGLTYADLASFPDDEKRRELLGGELIVTPSPRTGHQDVVWRLVLAFGNHLATHGGGRAFVAPLDVILSEADVVEPDIVFVSAGQLEIITESNIQGVPALLIEVLSNPRIDRVRKRDVYERFGVPEYAVVDHDGVQIQVFRLRDGRYGRPEIFEPGDTIEFSALPGYRLDVAKILGS